MKPENLDRAINIKKKLDEIDHFRVELLASATKGQAFLRTDLTLNSTDIELSGPLLDQISHLIIQDFDNQTTLLTKELETL